MIVCSIVFVFLLTSLERLLVVKPYISGCLSGVFRKARNKSCRSGSRLFLWGLSDERLQSRCTAGYAPGCHSEEPCRFHRGLPYTYTPGNNPQKSELRHEPQKSSVRQGRSRRKQEREGIPLHFLP